MNQKEWIQRLSILAIILLVISLGLLAINQAMGFYYKIELLSSPCSLCEKIKPPVIINWSNLTIAYP
jgi:hypothetical protein